MSSLPSRRIGDAALHVRGGINTGVDDPTLRYFLRLEQIQLTLGAAPPQPAPPGHAAGRSNGRAHVCFDR